MASDPDLAATVSVEELARGIDARFAGATTVFGRSPRATLRIGDTLVSDGASPALVEPDAEHVAHTLEMGRTLGEGGMGLVRLARQKSLGRPVAVKTARSEAKSAENARQMIREAWITGQVEHPNVVPIYDLTASADGSPVIVLKHIEGDAWSTLMTNGDRVRERFGAEDLLEWNLDVWKQLCRAVHFAHSKNVVHRDLKPDNVMVGSFGEVYVVDWGIAATTVLDPSGRLPFLGASSGIAGTPVYMAPEMLACDATALGTHTDVYLLGAVLYEIVTGSPPHAGGSFGEIARSILAPKFSALSGAPAELAAVCRKAMSRDPAERFASAEELRLAVQRFESHRGSLRLSAAAAERLVAMRSLDARAAQGDSSDDEAQAEFLAAFAEARFGFRQAKSAWSENAEADEGLASAVVLATEHELARGSTDTAAAFLSELVSPPPELLARVDAARSKTRKRLEALERLERDQDPRIGERARIGFALGIGATLVFAPLSAALFATGSTEKSTEPGYLGVVITSAIALLAVTGWRALRLTSINRGLLAISIFVCAVMLLISVSESLGVFPSETVILLRFFAPMCIVGAATLTVERRLIAAPFGYACAMFLVAHHPERRWWLMTGANVVLLASFAAAWLLPRAKETGGHAAQKTPEKSFSKKPHLHT